MIKYALQCDQDHSFESWFADAASFEKLQQAGHLACAVCGSSKVRKSLMAPGVAAGRDKPAAGPLSQPRSAAEQAVAEMRKQVEENADYVGPRFAEEARKMHDGETSDRAIYGEAKLEDAKKLIDDGIPVAPLPFLPKTKTN
ncbi:DUF1178 family protein [Nereida sp. MMG025]|uniref:DUF1178 family protein n=1 Tax=Nereida sp. MMG025 TaxID=2909981 RepID=UPI001F1CD681|nr:DUF1178 family protein [Nereida sp. MMG025]MCF6445054.1 DUF1178 family protein [Nereida sp. MMG025]